ncbi:MAG TPA: hypothetical protein VLC28_07675 [Flavitalea sp.]|nr:hypothetical protein [Flavitalea sp.]
MDRIILLVVSLVIFCSPLQAQHEHHGDHSNEKTNQKAKTDTIPVEHHHQHMEMGGDESMSMSHAFSRHLPMTRNGSGTSWLPDNSPMYAYMYHRNNWMYMLHGDIYFRYNKQDLFDKGSRGDAKFDAPNMVMFMGQRNVGKKGLFHFNTMFSLDPLTVGEEGYPLLFQTGETYQGAPLVDRQHPHDLFSELSVSYAYALSRESDVFVYLGYPGEPALGPAAYVHRPSGFFNPDAPLTHHWVDATHITFGVATAGLRYKNWKIEGSSFTGREPDENRYNFDKPRFDSYSGRLSFNPGPAWALQVSHGFIKEPELSHPEDVNRTTASATYSMKAPKGRLLNITGLWGMNKTSGHNAEHGVLLEGTGTCKKTTVYSRYEWVQKSVDELNLDEAEYGEHTIFPVHSITAGLSQELLKFGNTRIALGGQLSLYMPPSELHALYGKNPMAGEVYVRVYPGSVK